MQKIIYMVNRKIKHYNSRVSDIIKHEYINLAEKSLCLVNDTYKNHFRQCLVVIKTIEKAYRPLSKVVINQMKEHQCISYMGLAFEWFDVVIRAVTEGNQKRLLSAAHNEVYYDVNKIIA